MSIVIDGSLLQLDKTISYVILQSQKLNKLSVIHQKLGKCIFTEIALVKSITKYIPNVSF